MRLFVFMLLLVNPFELYAELVTPSDDVVHHVNVRDQAHDGNVIATLQTGSFAEIIGDEPHVWHIRMLDGAVGYISKRWTLVVQNNVPMARATGQLSLHFIDVGQGDSTLILCPDNSSILIDAGSTSGMAAETVRDYITENLGDSVHTIDTRIVTHADADHYNLLSEVLRGLYVGHLYHVGFQNHYDSAFWDWLNTINGSRKTRLDSAYFNPENQSNSSIKCGAAQIFILAADIRATNSWKNARSIVLMVRYGDFEAILTGDATIDTENTILSRYTAAFLDVELLKIGHHGSLSTSTSKAWADTLKPQIAVVSAGEDSQYGHPRNEVNDRLDDYTVNNAPPHIFLSATHENGAYKWMKIIDYNEQIYSTVGSGNIVISTDGNSPFTVRTIRHGEF